MCLFCYDSRYKIEKESTKLTDLVNIWESNWLILIIIMRMYCKKGMFLRGVEGRSTSMLRV